MVTSKHTSILLSGAALVSASFVFGAPLAAGATTTPSATSVIASVKAALKAETGVHVVVATVTGKVDTSVVAHIGTTQGSETYVSGGETFTITVTPTYAYLSGSKTGLTTLMGLSAAEQVKVGTSSIAMKAGTAPYKTFHSNLTSSAFTDLVPALKGTTLLSARDKKTNGYQLEWSTAATKSSPKTTSILTISSGKQALPLKELVTTADGTSETKFSKWGQKVVVKVPASTVAYSTIFAKG
jgi:hypothetical protein